jgi:predicted RNase H-like nuclease (RuvC/YqgF family)
MASRRFRRKYQSGGIIPSFQGAQVLGQPQRIEQRVNPIVFDPSSTFQAQSARQNSLRTAIQQGQFQRQERQDAWREEVQNRADLDRRLTAYRNQFQTGQDQLTKLDMNVPEQFQLAQGLRRDLDRINTESAAILTDNTLTPAQRGERLQEKILETQKVI